MMNLALEKEESKRKLILASVVCALTLLSGITLCVLAQMPTIEMWVRIVLIAIVMIEIVGGIGVACALDLSAGTFECRKCGKRFVPTASAFIAGPHTLRTPALRKGILLQKTADTLKNS